MLISHVHEWNIILVTRDTVLHACHLNETENRGPFTRQLINKKKKIKTPRNTFVVSLLSRNESIHKKLKNNFVNRKTNIHIYINDTESKSWNFSKQNSREFRAGISIWNNLTKRKRDTGWDTNEMINGGGKAARAKKRTRLANIPT